MLSLHLLIAAAALAQDDDLAVLDIASLEVQAREAHDAARYITARRLVDALLAADPDNLTGLYVMGRVQWLSEGNHARAMHYLTQADQVYRTQYGDQEDRPWQQHSEILYAMQSVAEETGDYGRQLELMDQYDSLFDPPFDRPKRAWAYMREDRMDEAREAAMAGITSEDTWDQVLGHNALCAVESALGERVAALEACRGALEHRRSYGQGSLSVAAGNAAGAALTALDFKQAEAWAREGATGARDVTVWRRLILLYTDQGRTGDAVDALRELRRAQARMEPSMRDLRRADIDAAYARLLLVAGESDKGLEVITRALTYPDRRGLISTDEDQARGGHAMLRLALRQLHAQRRAEHDATRRFVPRVVRWLARRLPDPGILADEAAIQGSLADQERLISTFRLYLDGGLNDAPSWLMGDLVPVLGAGVAEAAVQRAREAEAFPGMAPYYDAIEADIARHRRRWSRAAALAQAALIGLPEPEVLLRARMHALLADALLHQGQDAEAIGHIERVMQLDPGAFRRLGMSIPVELYSTATGAVGRHAEGMLRRSPRLHRGAGLQIALEGDSTRLRFCMLTPLGSQLFCEEVPRPVPVPDPETGETPRALGDYTFAQYAVRAFLDRAFAVTLNLSSVDLNSLDGTTTSRAEEERQRLQQALEGLDAP